MCYFHLNSEGNDKDINKMKANLMKSFLYSLVTLNLTSFQARQFGTKIRPQDWFAGIKTEMHFELSLLE